MPQYDEKHVKLCGGIVVWDGVTRPETVQQGQQAGKLKYTLKVVFPPNCPDLPIYEQLAQRALLESKWRGTLPAGGRMPIGVVQPHEFEGMFPGWSVISLKTTLRVPDVYDEHGQAMDAMQYGPLLYTGQQVDVLAHCYEYDAAGNKGISAGLDAFSVIASANKPRLEIGGGVNTAAAFGGAPAGQGQPAPGGPAAAPTPTPTASSAPGQTPAQAHSYLPGGPAAAPAAPGGPAPAPAPEVKYQTHDGQWTEAQLLAAGYTPEAIAALPRV